MPFPVSGDGFWADVKHNGRTIRVFSEVTTVGEVGAVYDLDKKAWIAREWVDSLEDGKKLAEAVVQQVLKGAPQIEWQKRKQV